MRAAVILALGVLHQPVSGLAVSHGVAARQAAAARRSRPLVALSGSPSGLVALDALMTRTVEQQVQSFAMVHDTARKEYLFTQWRQFLHRARQQSGAPAGSLTNFLSDLQRSEVTSIFVPKRSFRQLSPNNPYAAKSTDGTYEEVQPTQIVLRLISCREQLAEYWVELMPSLSTPQPTMAPSGGNETRAAASGTPIVDASSGTEAYDKQLLLGIATKLAARHMINERSMRPSCQHLHDWLKSYLLVENANELAAGGSVQRLHANLAAQPICIRGGAIVDPADLSLELFQRSVEILESMEDDLRAAPEHIVSLTKDFFESCLFL